MYARVILLSLFLTGCSGPVQTDMALRADGWLDQLEVNGLAGVVMIAKGDDITFEKALGMADAEAGIPNKIDTYFDAASIAKTLTGAAVLMAEQDGHLNTNDPLEKYLGTMPADKARATIHHLATHTAGLVQRGYDGLDGSTREAYIASIKAAPMESPAGQSYRYTNAGTSLLAAVLEIATGESWEDELQEKLFIPSNTAFRFYPSQDELGEDLAMGYGIRNGQLNIHHGGQGNEWGYKGAAGVYARAEDLINWTSFIVRGGALTPTQKSKMLDAREREAYGWHTDQDSEGRARIHKGGDSVNYTSQILYYPESDITIVWLVNDNQHRWRGILAAGLASIAHGGEAGPLQK